MKKILSVILLLITVFTFALGRPAIAADTGDGAAVYVLEQAEKGWI